MYYSKKDVKILLDKIDNEQDKFFVLAVYNCIKGRSYEDLAELKVTDINFSKKEMYVNGRTVEMDDYFIEITKEALKQQIYHKKGDKANHKEYEINTKSEYVLRPKPCVQTANGLAPYSPNGLSFKKFNLEKYIGEKFDMASLYRSGLINILIKLNMDLEIGKYRFDRLLRELKLKGTYKDVIVEMKEVLESKRYLEEYI